MARSKEKLHARTKVMESLQSDNERTSAVGSSVSTPNKAASGTKRKALSASPPEVSTPVIKAKMTGTGQRVITDVQLITHLI